jgi:hypothetical protein
LFVVALAALITSAPSRAWAWHIAGSVFCDENANAVIDAADSPIGNVSVRATSLTAAPGETFDATTSASGYYATPLPDRDDDYRVELTGLPPGTAVVLPSTGAYGAAPVPPIGLDANSTQAIGIDFLLTGCAPAATPSPSPSAVETPLVLPTPTATDVATPTVTPTELQTPTATVTPTEVPPPTATVTVTPTETEAPTATTTVTPTAVETPTATITVTPTGVATGSPTSTTTVAPTVTPTSTTTVAPTVTPTPTATGVATATPTPTGSPLVTSTPTPTATGTVLPTATQTGTPVVTATPTVGLPTQTPSPGSTPGAFAPSFQCYEIDRATLPAIGDLPVEDRYGLSLIDIGGRGKVKRLCNPASVNGQNPSAAADPNHLVGYVVTDRTPRAARIPDQVVTNQFGTTVLTALRPIAFLVPSAKSLIGPPAPLAPAAIDHYQCYAVGSAGKLRVDDLAVVDQFGSKTLDIKRPARLCVAADKRSEGILDPSAALMCYEVRASSGTPPFRGPNGPVYIANQFGADTLLVTRTTELCVPSTVTTQKARRPRAPVR